MTAARIGWFAIRSTVGSSCSDSHGSLVLSPLALVPTAALALVFELKARVEESMLAERFPEYAVYRARVRCRFVPGIR